MDKRTVLGILQASIWRRVYTNKLHQQYVQAPRRPINLHGGVNNCTSVLPHSQADDEYDIKTIVFTCERPMHKLFRFWVQCGCNACHQLDMLLNNLVLSREEPAHWRLFYCRSGTVWRIVTQDDLRLWNEWLKFADLYDVQLLQNYLISLLH